MTENSNSELNLTPWEVDLKDVDHIKLINHFGCKPITPEILKSIETLTNRPAHHLLRRQKVFAHRDLEILLQKVANGEKFYLYTGRGPSSRSMHLGHLIPFLFCKYLQDVFDVPLVIQLTDDEKFLFKNLSWDLCAQYADENLKDIAAVGFNPQKTFIFTNSSYAHRFSKNTLKISKSINLNEAKKVFGFTDSSNIGAIAFPATQIAPAFPSSFSFLKGYKNCLIPAAIDQDPFFRLARDKAKILKERKPMSIYSTFLPSLNGIDGKMSASENDSSIFLNDSIKSIRKKIYKAFSGGKMTVEEHRAMGGDTSVDVSFIYLTFLLDDDKELEELKEGYEKGIITSAEMKERCFKEISRIILEYQNRRNNLTEKEIEEFKKELEI